MGQPLEIPLNPSRVGLTVFGAIGKCLLKPVFMIDKSTNKEDFKTPFEISNGRMTGI
jgi:hypothetical protein